MCDESYINTNSDRNSKKEDNDMTTNTLQYKKLDFSKINSRIVETIPSVEVEAMKDIEPIKWNKDVLSGKKKVIITKERI